MSIQPPKDCSTTAFRPTYGGYASPSYGYALTRTSYGGYAHHSHGYGYAPPRQ